MSGLRECRFKSLRATSAAPAPAPASPRSAACAAQTEAIERLLSAQKAQQADDGSGDVVYALFLEPHDPPPGTTPSWPIRAVEFCVRNFQPAPAMAHVELVVPAPADSAQPINFSTYIGENSGWNYDREQNRAYYMSMTAGKWRAVPVFGLHAARKVRERCNESLKVDYSMLRYLTATPPVRAISRFVPDGPRAPAHCATLTARVLRRALGDSIEHSGAYYGPATLYAELTSELREQRIAPETTVVDGETQETVHKLLHDPLPKVQELADGEVLAALRALTLKVAAAEAFGDTAVQVLTQKQLASALLRWSVVREVSPEKQ